MRGAVAVVAAGVAAGCAAADAVEDAVTHEYLERPEQPLSLEDDEEADRSHASHRASLRFFS